MGELIGNKYSSFTLYPNVETKIANGTGAYYVSNDSRDAVSFIPIINYNSVFLLGENFGIKLKVIYGELYATSQEEMNIRVRTIYKK